MLLFSILSVFKVRMFFYAGHLHNFRVLLGGGRGGRGSGGIIYFDNNMVTICFIFTTGVLCSILILKSEHPRYCGIRKKT